MVVEDSEDPGDSEALTMAPKARRIKGLGECIAECKESLPGHCLYNPRTGYQVTNGFMVAQCSRRVGVVLKTRGSMIDLWDCQGLLWSEF